MKPNVTDNEEVAVSEAIEEVLSEISLEDDAENLPKVRTPVNVPRLTQLEREEIEKHYNATYASMEEAVKKHKVLNRKVISCGESPFKINGKVRTCLFLKIDEEHNFVGLIPFERVFDENPLNEDLPAYDKDEASDRARRETQILRKLIETTVDFIPTNIRKESAEDKSVIYIIGSRTAALRVQRYRNYKGRTIAGHRYPAALTPGNIYDANIVSVGEHIVKIELGGYETSVAEFKLTNRYIEDIPREFLEKKTIPVFLASVEDVFDENGKLIDVKPTISVHQAETELCRKHLRGIRVGNTIHATVSKVLGDDPKSTRYIGWVDEYDCPLKITNSPLTLMGTPLSRGQKVSVVVTQVNAGDDGHVRGNVIRILNCGETV